MDRPPIQEGLIEPGATRMKFQATISFNYGSVSDPQRIMAGDIYDSKDFDEGSIKEWMSLKWIKEVKIEEESK